MLGTTARPAATGAPERTVRGRAKIGHQRFKGGAMAWSLEGTYFENCSCDMVCPCTTSGLTMPADTERCQVMLAFHVDKGEIDGTDVADKTVIVLADTPPVMSEGNWKVGVIMDGSASAEQAEKLGGVFGGQMGGPMAALAPLITEMLGMESTAIDYVSDGRRHSVKAGSLVDVEIEDFVSPMTPDGPVEKLTGIFHPANSTLTIAKASKGSVSAFGMTFQNSGKNGHSAPFAWSS
jgi:hypothetical protein